MFDAPEDQTPHDQTSISTLNFSCTNESVASKCWHLFAKKMLVINQLPVQKGTAKPRHQTPHLHVYIPLNPHRTKQEARSGGELVN
jgi:hypothetical protein